MCRPYAGAGGSSASQGNCRTNWIGLQFTEASMFRPMISKATKPQSSESEAERAEIDRPDLRIADLAERWLKNPLPDRFDRPHRRVAAIAAIVDLARQPAHA